MYWYILYIGKQQNKRKNYKERSENPNIFIEKFSVSLKIILKNIAVVGIGYAYWQIYFII